MYHGRTLWVGKGEVSQATGKTLVGVVEALERAADAFLARGAACVHIEVYATCTRCHGFARLRCRKCHGTGEGARQAETFLWAAGSPEKAFDRAVNAVRDTEAWLDPDAIPVFLDVE